MVGGDKMLDFWKVAMASIEDLGELGMSREQCWGPGKPCGVG